MKDRREAVFLFSGKAEGLKLQAGIDPVTAMDASSARVSTLSNGDQRKLRSLRRDCNSNRLLKIGILARVPS
jgi:hypothetical protein